MEIQADDSEGIGRELILTETRERQSWDSRLTPDALKNDGVKIGDIILVWWALAHHTFHPSRSRSYEKEPHLPSVLHSTNIASTDPLHVPKLPLLLLLPY